MVIITIDKEQREIMYYHVDINNDGEHYTFIATDPIRMWGRILYEYRGMEDK